MSRLPTYTVYQLDDEGKTIKEAIAVYEDSPDNKVTADPFTITEKTLYYLSTDLGGRWFTFGTAICNANPRGIDSGLVEVKNQKIIKQLWEIYNRKAREFAND